ncbi:hypothetical protein CLV72_109224 [Allonocardiopsis opalescens]|uniref:Uncharacterized protein n=1 Tax=Allonocardiopsis opalescens TaxID=1144618 RepID=A0A2T0PVP9_9ACTN|nr:hypothetical protein CLV72_109224 [Allonocardiopsis opalescens]
MVVALHAQVVSKIAVVVTAELTTAAASAYQSRNVTTLIIREGATWAEMARQAARQMTPCERRIALVRCGIPPVTTESDLWLYVDPDEQIYAHMVPHILRPAP